jgi:hypothetical protein
VGAKQGENIITGIMTNNNNNNSERETLGEHLRILIDIAITCYITEFIHSESLIFQNTAVMNIPG